MNDFMDVMKGYNELQALIDIGIAGYAASLVAVGATSAYYALFPGKEPKAETETLPLRRKPIRESSLDLGKVA